MKKPNSKSYIGNPLGYFNDKAQYGKQTASSNFDPIDIAREKSDRRTSRKQNRFYNNQ